MLHWGRSFGHRTGRSSPCSIVGSNEWTPCILSSINCMDWTKRRWVWASECENLEGAGALGTRADKWFKLGPTLGLKLAVSSKSIAAGRAIFALQKCTGLRVKHSFFLPLVLPSGRPVLRACPALNLRYWQILKTDCKRFRLSDAFYLYSLT